MIPKIIHYVWYGKPMPESYVKFIENWKKILPDYKFMLWTDKDFENDEYDICKSNLKPGFFSDYIRLKVLYDYGGIYMDTDVELFKSFDDLLNYKTFICGHYDSMLGTAVIGAEKNNPLIKEMFEKLISDYNIKKEPTISNYWVTEYYIRKFDTFILNGKTQIIDNNAIFSKNYFEQPSWSKKNGGYSLHHCGGSWYDSKTSLIKKVIKRIVGIKLTRFVSEEKRKRNTPFWDYYKLQKKGIKPDNWQFKY